MDTIYEENDEIHKNSPIYKELVAALVESCQKADQLEIKIKPGVDVEKYYTVTEVMDILRISRKTLREYRNKGLIAYTSIGATILYPKSKIEEILNKNYNGFFIH